jgi:hypothetical protein
MLASTAVLPLAAFVAVQVFFCCLIRAWLAASLALAGSRIAVVLHDRNVLWPRCCVPLGRLQRVRTLVFHYVSSA